MARKLDRHFKCPKSLKTVFALRNASKWLKQTLMDVHNTFIHSEYAVEPRSAKSVNVDEKKPQRKKHS